MQGSVDENENILLSKIQGRWGENEHPSKLAKGERTRNESINFPNNGSIRHLNLVIKYPEDEYCYAYNDDSYDYIYYQNPAFIIKAKRFFVEVDLLYPFNLNKKWIFEVIVKGKYYKIRYGEKWIETPKGSQATKKLIVLQPTKITKRKSSRKKTS